MRRGDTAKPVQVGGFYRGPGTTLISCQAIQVPRRETATTKQFAGMPFDIEAETRGRDFDIKSQPTANQLKFSPFLPRKSSFRFRCEKILQ